MNCYNAAQVPQTAVIDADELRHAPTPGYITSPYGYRRRFRRDAQGRRPQAKHRRHRARSLRRQSAHSTQPGRPQRLRLWHVCGHTPPQPASEKLCIGHLSGNGSWNRPVCKRRRPDSSRRQHRPLNRPTPPLRDTRYMGYAINPCAIFDFANQTTHTDTYTFDKNTYQNARNSRPRQTPSTPKSI